MLAYDLSAPRSFVSKRVINGRQYEVHVFQRALFPLTAGRYEIPAARLNYSLPLSASFFSREESHQLRSETVPLVVMDPPQTGKSAGLQRRRWTTRVRGARRQRRGEGRRPARAHRPRRGRWERELLPAAGSARAMGQLVPPRSACSSTRARSSFVARRNSTG